jgi:hypothetical protein
MHNQQADFLQRNCMLQCIVLMQGVAWHFLQAIDGDSKSDLYHFAQHHIPNGTTARMPKDSTTTREGFCAGQMCWDAPASVHTACLMHEQWPGIKPLTSCFCFTSRSCRHEASCLTTLAIKSTAHGCEHLAAKGSWLRSSAAATCVWTSDGVTMLLHV